MCVRKINVLVMPHMESRAGAAGLQAPVQEATGFLQTQIIFAGPPITFQHDENCCNCL